MTGRPVLPDGADRQAADIISIAERRPVLRMLPASDRKAQDAYFVETINALSRQWQGRRQFDALIVLARGMVAPQKPRHAKPNRRPDGDLIWCCQRLLAINAAIEAAYVLVPHDEGLRDTVIVPLHEEFRCIQDEMLRLKLAYTLNGARAMAELALTQAPREAEAAIEANDLYGWLAVSCMEYLVRPNRWPTLVPSPDPRFQGDDR